MSANFWLAQSLIRALISSRVTRWSLSLSYLSRYFLMPGTAFSSSPASAPSAFLSYSSIASLEADEALISTGWTRLARWLQPANTVKLPMRHVHAHRPTMLAGKAPRNLPDQDGPA